MSTTLIKNGYLLTMDPSGTRFHGDVLVEGRQIQRIAPSIEAPADKIIDASDMLVLPGFVQAHVHLCQSLLRG